MNMGMIAAVLAGLIGVALMVGFTVWISLWSLRRQRLPREAYSRLLRELGGAANGMNLQQVAVQRGAAKADIWLRPGGKNSPPVFNLTVHTDDVKSPPMHQRPAGTPGVNPFRAPAVWNRGQVIEQDQVRPITLRRETIRDKIGKFLFINKEWETGDERFDKSVYVETTASSHVLERVLSSPEVRDLALRMLNQGWSSVTLQGTPGRSVTVSAVHPTEALLATQGVSDTIDGAIFMAETLPQMKYANVSLAKAPYSWLPATMIAVDVVVVVLVFVVTNIWSPIDGTLYAIASGLGFLAWVLALPLLVLLLRGYPTSLRNVVWTYLALAVALPVGGIDLGVMVNGIPDFQAPTKRTLKVLRVWTVHGSKSSSYYIRLAPWAGRTEPVKLRISRRTRKQFSGSPRAGRYATLTEHPGVLGFPWWSKVVPAAAPEKSRAGTAAGAQ